MKKKILFYSRDGRGLGHLSRLSKIARSLQKDYSCLFFGGHKEMAWMVPEESEYYYCPKNIPFRKKLFDYIHESYCPDIIIIDHSILGNNKEMVNVAQKSKAIKILLLRGVLNTPAKIQEIFFNKLALSTLLKHIDYIYVACDEKIVDIFDEYNFPKELINRTQYIGYIAEQFPSERRTVYREERKLGSDRIHVVSSCGAGYGGLYEPSYYYYLEKLFPACFFDVIYGTRNNAYLESSDITNVNIRGNVWEWTYNKELPSLHSCSDIMLSRAGYSSLTEGIIGNTFVICNPIEDEPDLHDEQYIHATRLSKYYNKLIISQSASHTESLLRELCSNPKLLSESTYELNMNGITELHSLIENL
ncbi:MAG: glycosyltransferase [Bacteroidetes bacterium]|nr:glycosyltransferase [Bacteroidota bacterium]